MATKRKRPMPRRREDPAASSTLPNANPAPPSRAPAGDTDADLFERLVAVESAWYARSLAGDERAALIARVLRGAVVASESDLGTLRKEAERADHFAAKHGGKPLPRSTRETLEVLIKRIDRLVHDPEQRPYAHFRFVEAVVGTRFHQDVARAGADGTWLDRAGRVERAWQPLFARAMRKNEWPEATQLVRIGLRAMGLKRDVFAAERNEQLRLREKLKLSK